ncbi:hypothetical protein AtEden1_Chr1g0043461 [Arabidopsis thaliana]
MDSDSELRLLSLISQLLSPSNTDSDAISNMIQIISMVSSLDLNTQPKPQSKLMSLITETISLFNSMNLDSQPEPLRKLVSLSIQKVSHLNFVGSDYEPKPDPEFMYMFYETFNLEPMPKLISTIDQV